MNPIANPDDTGVEKRAAAGVRWMIRRHAPQDVHDAPEGHDPGVDRARGRGPGIGDGIGDGVETEAANLMHGTAGEAYATMMCTRIGADHRLVVYGVRIEHHAGAQCRMHDMGGAHVIRRSSIAQLPRIRRPRPDPGGGMRAVMRSGPVIGVHWTCMHRFRMDRAGLQRIERHRERIGGFGFIENHAIGRSRDRVRHRTACCTKIRGRQVIANRAVGIEHPSSLAAALATPWR